MNSQEKLQSQVINFLRFPLIVGVVCIHSDVLYEGITLPMSLDAIFNEGIRNLISQVISRISVPLFFLISGFLFFYKADWGWNIYRKKLNSRIRTLFVPYLFWNILALLFFLSIVFVPIGRTLYPNTFEHYSRFSLLNWAQGLWGTFQTDSDAFSGPFAYQFWFIRDLMVMVTLTPVIHWLILKFKWYIVVVLGIVWFPGDYHVPVIGLSTTAVFFFFLGAYFSINSYNLVEQFRKFFLFSFVLYPLVACLDLLTKQYSWNMWIHHAGILAGILFAVNLSVWLLKKKNIKINGFLLGASFFIYAVHVPILLPHVQKMLYVLIPPRNGWALLLIYFLVIFIVVGISLGLYRFLKRYFPCFLNRITGGR